MRTLFNAFGFFSLGAALLGLGAALFGDAGLWGFLVFLFGAWFGGFWLLLGLLVKKVGRLREMLFPATPEAALRRRLLLASFRGSAKREADEAMAKLRRLEHVWAAIQRHLRERLDPGELTFGRYEESARRGCVRALQGLTDATSLVESLGVLARGPVDNYLRSRNDPQDPQQTRRGYLRSALDEAEAAIAALERLDLALVGELRTGAAAREEALESTVAELDRLSGMAKRYASGP
ncbi:MAG TPA: hypothetical protein VIW02_04400 [Gammaproteobacteria bacterium]